MMNTYLIVNTGNTIYVISQFLGVSKYKLTDEMKLCDYYCFRLRRFNYEINSNVFENYVGFLFFLDFISSLYLFLNHYFITPDYCIA